MYILLSKIALSTALFSSLAFSIPSTTTYTRAEPQKGISIMAEVTSYNSEPGQTDDTPFITASGTHVHEKTVACPRYYAFGTLVEIEWKEYICEDRMNKRFPDRFDIWLPSKEESIEWGIRKVEIIIIENVDN